MRSLIHLYHQTRRDRWIRRAYGTGNPATAEVIGGAHRIQIDPTDDRARKVLLYDTARGRQKSNQAFWFLASRLYLPTLCIDVGLNYGECLLAGDAPPGASMHGFEANPNLRSFIQRTLRNHPARDRISMHYGAVSDREGDELQLAIDPNWSGGSHITASGNPANDRGARYTTVRTLTIDGTVPRPRPHSRVLFKVDVEGYEAAVVRGMHETIQSAPSAVGFLELNPELMEQRSTGLDGFWEFLSSQFEIRFCSGIGCARRLNAQTWQQAKQEVDCPHGDLILTNQPDCPYQQRVLDAWQALRRQTAAA